MTYNMQAGQSMAAGYFGGYSAKMQDVGQKELQRMEQAMERTMLVESSVPAQKLFPLYSKRLVQELEAEGAIRTSVESLNLSLHADGPDVLSVECLRTFPIVTFPA